MAYAIQMYSICDEYTLFKFQYYKLKRVRIRKVITEAILTNERIVRIKDCFKITNSGYCIITVFRTITIVRATDNNIKN